ncbi:MAG: RHS repeat-associated core domain-containing protein, partial [Candidatus Eiseniibacteriota bacterium]
AGELRLKSGSGADTGYVYDPLGNLVSVTLPSADIFKYSSDGAGRRVGRRSNGSWTGGWVYQNALNVAGELDNTGAVTRRYVYGVEPHVPALMLEGSATYRLITDQLGSVRGVVDVSSGAIVQRRDYDAWGVVTLTSGTNTQALGYAGGLTDASTGLVRFGARDYDPAAGRWTCKDPVGFGGGDANLYDYASDSPVRWTDHTGLAEGFVLGAYGSDTPPLGPLRGSGEVIGLVGLNDKTGAFAADVAAVGGQAGSLANFVGAYRGVEISTNEPTKGITIVEGDFGLDAVVAGLGAGGGFYRQDSGELGFFVFATGAAIGQHGALGVGGVAPGANC